MRRTFAKLWKLAALALMISFFQSFAFAESTFVDRKDVQSFISHMVAKHRFQKDNLNALFAEVKVRPQVMKSINKPLEKETWNLYQMLFVNEWRIKHGVEFWDKYEAALSEAEKRFGVPASIIIATIGIETRYGERIGDYRAIDSLSNIAFSDSSRAKFFKKELEEFLMLTREQHLDPLKVMASYAGAIGQPQFMPSSYRNYAINFSKSGQTDLMHNEIDVIGSIANYYQKHGWKPKEPIAVQALIVGRGFDFLMRKGRVPLPLTINELGKYGIVPKTKIDKEDLPVNVIELASNYNKEYWLGFHNFDVIKRYNASDLYAMAVYQLSYYISTLRGRLTD